MGSHSLLMEGSADIHPSKLRNLPEPSEVDSATDAAEASSSRPDDPRGMSFSLFDVRRSEADATASTKPGRGAGAEAKAKRRRTSGLPAKVASETVPSFVNHGSSPGPGSRNPSAGTPRSHALGQPQAAPTKKVTELMQKAQDTFPEAPGHLHRPGHLGQQDPQENPRSDCEDFVRSVIPAPRSQP